MDPAPPDTPTMRIAQIVPCTEAEGPGRRFALWFQGCPLRCTGCCNPEFLAFGGGSEMSLVEVTAAIARTQEREGIEGVTLLGGEPFAHAAAGAALAAFAHSCGLSVMAFSGYTLDDLHAQSGPAVRALLAETDILVDGPYRRDEPDTERRWVGSRNQRVHFLTDRYRADDARWRQRNTLEIRVDRAAISVNGFPSAGAAALWKGWRRKAAHAAAATPDAPSASTDGANR